MRSCWVICAILWGLSQTTWAADEQHMVTLSVRVISAEGHELDPKADTATLLKTISDLESAGKLLSSMDIQLTAIEGQPANCHFGATEAIITGRNFVGGFGRTATPSGSGNIPGSVPIYSREESGTILTATTQVTEAGVMAELKFEQSKFTKTHPKGDGDEAPLPPAKEVLAVQTRILLPENQPVVVGGVLTKVDGEKTIASVMIATAKVGLPVSIKSADASPQLMRVFALQKLEAGTTQEFLQKIFQEDDLKLVADHRTNSLVVRGPEKQLENLGDLIQQLDR